MSHTLIISADHLEQALLPLALVADITVEASTKSANLSHNLTLSQFNGQPIRTSYAVNQQVLLTADKDALHALDRLLASMKAYHITVEDDDVDRFVAKRDERASSQTFHYQAYFLKQMVTAALDGRLNGYLDGPSKHGLLNEWGYDEARSLFNYQTIQWIDSPSFSAWLNRVEKRVDIMAEYHDDSVSTIAFLETLIDKLTETHDGLHESRELEQSQTPH